MLFAYSLSYFLIIFVLCLYITSVEERRKRGANSAITSSIFIVCMFLSRGLCKAFYRVTPQKVRRSYAQTSRNLTQIYSNGQKSLPSASVLRLCRPCLDFLHQGSCKGDAQQKETNGVN